MAMMAIKMIIVMVVMVMMMMVMVMNDDNGGGGGGDVDDDTDDDVDDATDSRKGTRLIPELPEISKSPLMMMMVMMLTMTMMMMMMVTTTTVLTVMMICAMIAPTQVPPFLLQHLDVLVRQPPLHQVHCWRPVLLPGNRGRPQHPAPLPPRQSRLADELGETTKKRPATVFPVGEGAFRETVPSGWREKSKFLVFRENCGNTFWRQLPLVSVATVTQLRRRKKCHLQYTLRFLCAQI